MTIFFEVVEKKMKYYCIKQDKGGERIENKLETGKIFRQ